MYLVVLSSLSCARIRQMLQCLQNSSFNIVSLHFFSDHTILTSKDITRLAPWISYLDDDLTLTSPRLGWLQFAVRHPPLFHATLLSSAVHLNRRKRLKDPSALLFYKLQVIRHANEVMRNGTVDEKSSDEMIVTALCLLYFDINGEVRVEEYMVHLRGIEMMLAVRGGMESLGMRGMVRNWLKVCHGPWSPGFAEGGF